MDFFEYASLAEMFVNAKTWYVPFIVGGICFLIVFAFQAVGLFIIAGHEGYNNRWMAFVPFLNTYYIGVCGQKNRCFRSVDTKKLALAACILEAVLFFGYIVYYVAVLQLTNAGCVYEVEQDAYYLFASRSYELRKVPVELAWAGWCFEYLDNYILTWVDLIFLFLQVLVLSAFFQTYAARRYMLFTITSVFFPIQGILIFMLRNNSGMSYQDFLRREQERQYKMYQQYRRQSYDGNPYDQNPYSRNPYNDPRGGYGGEGRPSSGGAPQDPFGEYGTGSNSAGAGKDDDPFDGFGRR